MDEISFASRSQIPRCEGSNTFKTRHSLTVASWLEQKDFVVCSSERKWGHSGHFHDGKRVKYIQDYPALTVAILRYEEIAIIFWTHSACNLLAPEFALSCLYAVSYGWPIYGVIATDLKAEPSCI